MTFAELSQELEARQIVLRLEADGRIGYTAPSGALTPDLVGAMKAHKAGLIAALTSEPLAETPQDDELPDLEAKVAPEAPDHLHLMIDLADLKRRAEAWEFKGMNLRYAGIELKDGGVNSLLLGDLLRLETLKDGAERQKLLQRLAEFAEAYA